MMITQFNNDPSSDKNTGLVQRDWTRMFARQVKSDCPASSITNYCFTRGNRQLAEQLYLIKPTQRRKCTGVAVFVLG